MEIYRVYHIDICLDSSYLYTHTYVYVFVCMYIYIFFVIKSSHRGLVNTRFESQLK